MSLKDGDEEQIQLVNELKGMGKGKRPVKKRCFFKNAESFLSVREKILNNFKSKIFSIKNSNQIPTLDPALEPAVFDTPNPTKRQINKSSLKISEFFLNKIANDKTNINTGIFNEYFLSIRIFHFL